MFISNIYFVLDNDENILTRLLQNQESKNTGLRYLHFLCHQDTRSE